MPGLSTVPHLGEICNQNFLTLSLAKFTSPNFCYLISVTPIHHWGGIMAHGLNTCLSLTCLHTIFSIGPQWENRYELTLNLTKPQLPWVFMTYHDHSQPIKTNTYEPLCLAQIYVDFHNIFIQHRFIKFKQIWNDPKPGSISFNLFGHDLSWP